MTTATRWVGAALASIRATMETLHPEGLWHSGEMYWGYSSEHMLKLMYPARDLLGIDFFVTPWWRNTTLHLPYLALPRNAWTRYNGVVNLGDCPRRMLGPDYVLRALAREYRDGHAQWWAEEVRK